jgi:hypothetical protein
LEFADFHHGDLKAVSYQSSVFTVSIGYRLSVKTIKKAERGFRVFHAPFFIGMIDESGDGVGM